jgi:hypothetical protein
MKNKQFESLRKTHEIIDKEIFEIIKIKCLIMKTSIFSIELNKQINHKDYSLIIISIKIFQR